MPVESAAVGVVLVIGLMGAPALLALPGASSLRQAMGRAALAGVLLAVITSWPLVLHLSSRSEPAKLSAEELRTLVRAMGQGGNGVYMLTKGSKTTIPYLESIAAEVKRQAAKVGIKVNLPQPVDQAQIISQAIGGNVDAFLWRNYPGADPDTLYVWFHSGSPVNFNKINDPVIRQEIAKLMIMAKSAEWTARRARTAQEQGKPQGPEGSLGKLASSHIARAAARIHTTMLGADALLSGEDSPMNGLLAEKKATYVGIYVRVGSKYGDVMRAVDLLRKSTARNIGVSSIEISGNREP